MKLDGLLIAGAALFLFSKVAGASNSGSATTTNTNPEVKPSGGSVVANYVGSDAYGKITGVAYESGARLENYMGIGGSEWTRFKPAGGYTGDSLAPGFTYDYNGGLIPYSEPAPIRYVYRHSQTGEMNVMDSPMNPAWLGGWVLQPGG